MSKEETVEETIYIDEEDTAVKGEKSWTEEFTVAGNEVVDTVKRLIHEAGVRRLVIKNDARNINFEVPLVLGVAGMIMLPAAITMIAVVTALVADCQILVERVEKAPDAETAVA
jgi:hypothetical protein